MQGAERIHMKIDREDMLELTRRMTLARNCFDRAAGAYMDEDGYEEGSYNIHFLKLSAPERERNLKLAKTVPFSETNHQLKLYDFPGKGQGSADVYRLLLALNDCGLKNDALLETLYELTAGCFQPGKPYAVCLYHGIYDIPRKASDKERLWESEEVYHFLILCICGQEEAFTPGKPEWGILFPAFMNRSSDPAHIAVFEADPDHPHTGLLHGLLGISP